VYTAYRDSDTIFSSKDLASGVYELWQKKGATNIAEVRIDLQQGLSSGWAAAWLAWVPVQFLYPSGSVESAFTCLQVSRLQRNVDDLQHALLKTLHDRQQPTVIVTGNGKSG
jgi:hypothetical protein